MSGPNDGAESAGKEERVPVVSYKIETTDHDDDELDAAPPVEDDEPPAVEGDHDEDEDEGDERLSADERDEEDLTPEDRKRKARQRQRQRRNEERRVLRAENEELKARIARLEGRFVETDRRTLADQIRSVEAAYQQSMKDLEESIETGDGKRHAEAMAARDQLIIRRQQLESEKQRLERAPAPRQPEVDPRVKDAATRWTERNRWFDAKGSDIDSKVVLTIDAELSKRPGADPTSDDYWRMLDREVRRRLPHRFRSGTTDEGRRGPPVTGRSDGGRPLTGNVRVNMTAARRQALQELGVWGDQKAMEPYLKEFAEFDRQNAR